MEAAQPLRGRSEDRQWQVASCQSASRADVPVLCVSACCSAAARSAAANAGLVWKLGYAAIGVRRPGAAACATQTLDARDCGTSFCAKQIYDRYVSPLRSAIHCDNLHRNSGKTILGGG